MICCNCNRTYHVRAFQDIFILHETGQATACQLCESTAASCQRRADFLSATLLFMMVDHMWAHQVFVAPLSLAAATAPRSCQGAPLRSR
jgi:hypothetical protein